MNERIKDKNWHFGNGCSERGGEKMKDLKGSDIILNLKEIAIGDIDTFASSHCGGRAYFEIECETEHGYCEDPDFTGKIKILSIQRDKQKGVYHAKIKFIKEKSNYSAE